MSIDRWMDKEAVVHIYNGILLRHKKGHSWVSSNEVDEPRAYYTEWSKSERKKQIYTNAYIWNLERWYWWIYLQGTNGETDKQREQTYGHGERGGEGEMYVENIMETYITVFKIGNQWEFAVWLRELKQGLCNSLQGWDGERDGRVVQEGGDICIAVTDSCLYLAENKNICKAIIFQLKNK